MKTFFHLANVAITSAVVFFFLSSCGLFRSPNRGLALYTHLRVPAVICSELNAARYDLLDARGNEIIAAYEDGEISRIEALGFVEILHQADDEIRKVVALQWQDDDGEFHDGECIYRLDRINEMANNNPGDPRIFVELSMLASVILSLEQPLHVMGASGITGAISLSSIGDESIDEAFRAFIAYANGGDQ